MPYPIDEKLVIAVSSSALFDMQASDAIFRQEGEDAYRKYQQRMKARAAVKNFHTEVPQRTDDQILIFAGAFTGENVTRVVGSYISIPIRIGVQITKGYFLEAGGFVALVVTRIFSGKVENGYLWTHPTDSEPVSSKIPIASADYSFSDNISRMDAGVELYGSHSLGANILLNVGLGVGLIPLFDTHHFKGIPFAMYNIYLNMALGYRFE